MVKALAEHFIEKEFGVKSETTIWREHLYELQGSTELSGTALVARIKAGEEVPFAHFPAVPMLSIRMAHMPRFESFEGMRAEIVDCHAGKVNLLLTAPAGHASALLVWTLPPSGSISRSSSIRLWRTTAAWPVPRPTSTGPIRRSLSRQWEARAVGGRHADVSYEAMIGAAEARLQARKSCKRVSSTVAARARLMEAFGMVSLLSRRPHFDSPLRTRLMGSPSTGSVAPKV